MDEQDRQHEAPAGISRDARAVPAPGEAEKPPAHPGAHPCVRAPGLGCAILKPGCSIGTFPGPHAAPHPLLLLPCLSFGPGGLAAGLAASTRNPGRGKQTKHRLSPGSPSASARLPSFFPSWPAPPRREKLLQLGIASLPCPPPQQSQRDSGCTPGHSCFPKERRDDVPIASCAQPWAASVPFGDPGGAPGSPCIPARHSWLINALYYLTGMRTSPQTGRL